MKQEQTTKMETRTYPYERLMLDDECWRGVSIFTDPKIEFGKVGDRMERYRLEAFAKMILFGQIEVVDVPNQIWVHEMDKMQTWLKITDLLHKFQEEGFTVDECPHCGSKDIEYDFDSEADGCQGDWAVWHHWSVDCNDCDDFSHKGQYIAQSGGW